LKRLTLYQGGREPAQPKPFVQFAIRKQDMIAKGSVKTVINPITGYANVGGFLLLV
jgi:hypothetical protein